MWHQKQKSRGSDVAFLLIERTISISMFIMPIEENLKRERKKKLGFKAKCIVFYTWIPFRSMSDPRCCDYLDQAMDPSAKFRLD